MTPYFDLIPQALRDCPQWVLWRYEMRGGRPNKEPFQPCGRHASSTDRQTWSTFTEAKAACERGGFNGVGFVFSDADYFYGIDLDGCRDPESGAFAPWALDILERAQTYCEVSPSGTGVKLFCTSATPIEKHKVKVQAEPLGGKKAGIEIYWTGRYFCVTGCRESASTEGPTEQTALVDWIKETHPKAKGGANGQQTGRSPLTFGTIDPYWTPERRMHRASRYIAKLPPAVSEHHGHDRTFQVARLLVEFGIDRPDAELFMLTWNQSKAVPPWSEKDLQHKLNQAFGAGGFGNRLGQLPERKRKGLLRAPATLPSKCNMDVEAAVLPLTEFGLAERLVLRYGNFIRFSKRLKTWFAWDGKRWAPEETGEIDRYAFAAIRAIYNEAAATEDAGLRGKLREFAEACETSKALTNMLRLAQHRVAIRVDELDADPWLFNCANGTLDLRTGKLRPHDPKDLITKVCGVGFDPSVESPRWHRFIDQILDGRPKLAVFLKQLFGYGITGKVNLQILPIFWGSGANGKSTLLNIIRTVMGSDYAAPIDEQTLFDSKQTHHPTVYKTLHGRRLVYASESTEGQGLNESRIKRLTGGEKIPARGMFENYYEFDPSHLLVLQTNHKPRVKGSDHAIWRRLALVPFEVTFWDRHKGEAGPAHLEADKFLEDRIIHEEASGVLAWMVQGCLEWLHAGGLEFPSEVRIATREYRQEEDELAKFLDDECECGDQHLRVRAADLHDAFNRWAGGKISKRTFGTMMTNAGFDRIDSGGRWYIGVRLKTTNYPQRA